MINNKIDNTIINNVKLIKTYIKYSIKSLISTIFYFWEHNKSPSSVIHFILSTP